MTFRTLIILGSSLTALSVARTASRQGLRCIMVDDRPGLASTTRAAEFRLLASASIDGLVACSGGIESAGGIAVVADSDRWLRFVRDHRGALAALGWLVLHPSAQAIDICLDKSVFLKWCASQGLPAPRWYDPSASASLSPDHYPLLIRPEWTQHSSNTGLPKAIEARDAETLRYWLNRFAAVGVTPCVSSSLLREGLRQLSIGAARSADGRTCTFVAEKIRPHANECAGGTFVVPVEHDEARTLAVAALDTLDFFGIAEVEVLYDTEAKRGYLVEVNGRPWLQYGLPYACGCDMLGHLGASTAGPPVPGRGGHAWLYFSSDLYACFSRTSGLVRNRTISFAQYFQSLAAADVYALWDRRDPVPWMLSATRTLIASVKGLLKFG
jgi:predicted ATP-grasp superfamily ATP-dependent carboligase